MRHGSNTLRLSWSSCILLVALLLCCHAAPVPAGAADGPSPEVRQVLEQILTSQQGTETLQGRFTQRKSMALFKDPELSSGTFSYRQPEMMRLDYETPNRVILLLEGDYLLTYYPDLGEAERFDVRKQKKRVFEHLIGREGIGQLQKNFTIELKIGDGEAGTGPPSPEGETIRLHLVPRRRQLKKRLEFIDLWVRTTDHAPVQYFIQEKSGDSTLFSLEQVVVNGTLPENAFAIDLPEGVVISERSASNGGKDGK